MCKGKGKINMATLIQREVQNQIGQLSSRIVELSSNMHDPLARSLNVSSVNAVHQVMCSSCKKKPVIGILFVCHVCADFNLCMDCEEDLDHSAEHAMLIYKKPQQKAKVNINVLQAEDEKVLKDMLTVT